MQSPRADLQGSLSAFAPELLFQISKLVPEDDAASYLERSDKALASRFGLQGSVSGALLQVY